MAINAGALAGVQAAIALYTAGGAATSASAQKQMLGAQAALDIINARSTASSLNAQADLSVINAKANANATLSQAQLDTVGAGTQALTLRTNAAVSALDAQSSAAGLQAGASIAENNANLDELMAQSALLHGQWDESATMLQAGQTKATQIATMAARGVDLGEGTPLNVLNSTDVMGQQKVIQIQQNAMLQAFGYRVQEANENITAAVKTMQAGMATTMSGVNTTLANVNADALVANANASFDAKKALADAGLLDAEATANVQKTYANNVLINGESAAKVKQTLADGINPNAAYMSSLLTTAGQVAPSWYALLKSNGVKP